MVARYRRKRRRTRVRSRLLLASAVAVAVSAWWFYPSVPQLADAGGKLAVGSQPVLTNDRPEIVPKYSPAQDVTEKGATPRRAAPSKPTESERRTRSILAIGKETLERNDLVEARTLFNEALRSGASETEKPLLRAELTRLGNDTIFSGRLFPGDPFVERHVIQPGETLGKIAKANKVSADLLANINGIRDKNRIRGGQSIKVIKGPFHAVVDKTAYSLDVYLDTTFVKSFKVGLGAEGSTPSGEWRVTTKLTNPAYYPPRGGMIVTADDPENPLGERWIGLAGVSGDATGQLRYGIHGTIEPDSIGRNVSLGCIRMYNEDVEALYTYLVEKYSTVSVHE